MRKSILVAAIVGLVAMAALSACSSPSTATPLPTSTSLPTAPPTNTPLPTATGQPTATVVKTEPIEIVSVIGALQPLNPAGPIVEITLKNVSVQPVVSLASVLQLNRAFTFNFNAVPTSPLLPGNTISARQTLIGGAFSTDTLYALTVTGTRQDGATFLFTKQVQITTLPTT